MKRPNIILIMTDQQRGDCLGIEDHPVLLTPNMDSIAGQGARFAKCYSTCPVCIPARRSLLSGQFPSTHGMVGYRDGVSEWDAQDSFPTMLRNAGYQTYLAGRSMHQHPERKRYGYDHMVLGGPDYSRWLRSHLPVDSYQGAGDYYSSGIMNIDWTARSWPYDEALHQTNWTVNEAMRFLQNRDPSCPYFLTVSFLAPHPPLIPPAFYLDRYLRQTLLEPAIGDWAVRPVNGGKGMGASATRVDLRGEALHSARAAYYGLINHIDDQIRRFLYPHGKEVDLKNTIVIFTSDHGEMLGDHHLWKKSLPYESSARVPLLIQAPEAYGIRPGTVIDKPVCLEDIMPTILEMVGLDIPGSVEGRSLLPLLHGERIHWRSHLHIEHSEGVIERELTFHALTNGKEKYIWFSWDGNEQFFDLAVDPSECRNLIGQAELGERIAHWRRLLIEELKDRPEGFSDGSQLIPGRPYLPVMPSSQI
ncbi:arylsulfatase [Paenibacillus koleovorans]|uniref:arylsulfatase n=1 Tax=Paenibacillus koleovorans TaxID=121608 RepID=UPI000FDA04B8|nr:arylsulfatase [Paenibacillus koleovorans]